jgi:PAS domain S-box-containing protein
LEQSEEGALIKKDTKTKQQLLLEMEELRMRLDIAEQRLQKTEQVLQTEVPEHEEAKETFIGAQKYAASIAETIREPFLVLSPNLKVISANRSFYETFQVTPGETEGHLIYNIGNRQWDIPALRELLEDIIATNADFNDFEIDYEFPGIGRRRILLNARRIDSEAQKTEKILLAITGVTEQKEAERTLLNTLQEAQQHQAEISALLKSSKAVLELHKFDEAARIIFDSCKNLIKATAGYVALLSRDGSENELLFLDSGGLACTVDPSLPMPIRGLREEAYRTGKTVFHNDLLTSEYVKFMPQGHARLYNVLFAPLVVRNKVIGIIGIANKPGGFTQRDVLMASAFGELASISLSNSRILEALRISEERLQSIVQTAKDAIISVNGLGEIIFWNQSAETVFGYSSEEVINKSLTVIIPERFHEAHKNGMSRVTQTGKSKLAGKTIEMVGRKKDGREFPLELSLASWEGGEGVFFTGIIRDITERKKTEKALEMSHAELESRVKQRTAELSFANEQLEWEIKKRQRVEITLRESETKYRIVADNTYDWEWWRDPEGNFIYVSPSCKRITHHEAEEFLTDPDLLFRIISPEDKSSFIRHLVEVHHKHSPGEIEFRIIRPDGSLRWIGHVCQPAYDEKGCFLGLRGSNRDITERKCAEEALRESEKQLRYLSSKLLTAQETERGRISRELHDELGGALAVLKLRSNVIEKKLQKDQIELREECKRNLKYIDQIIENVGRLSRDLSPSILKDFGLSVALRWLIDNFVKNYNVKVASEIVDVDHLFPKDAQIMIYRIFQEALTNIGKHARAKSVSMKVKKDEDRISFSVEDDGKGFDVEHAAMKEAPDRGLGLATMDERARMLEGSLDLWSKKGKGTRITLSIPMKKEKALYGHLPYCGG